MMSKNLILENEYELADTMLDIVDRECVTVSCIAHYEYIRDLLKAVIVSGYEEVNIANIVLQEEDIDWYDKEFILSITEDGEIWVEKAYMESHEDYVWLEDEVLFIHDDCNSRIIGKIDNEDAVVVYFDYSGEECEEDYDYAMYGCDVDCEHCELAEEYEEDTDMCNCEDDDMHGFSLHKETENGSVHYSFYSTDQNMVERVRRELMR